MKFFFTGLLAFGLVGCTGAQQMQKDCISGIYPKLAMYNNEGECGTGAVVPWAGSLWAITYGPHLPFGSSDKLYQITPDKKVTVRSESIGGTPANRLIHKESNQLNIGPYFISQTGDVRVLPWQDAPGRYTGAARHLTDPTNKIYIGTMEEGFYEVDVHTLKAKELYKDSNEAWKLYRKDPKNNPKHVELLPGAHGKGLYSGQGVMVFSNNGENSSAAMKYFDALSGSLSEWDGKDWKVVRRNQFVELTGPGGIYGNPNPGTDPIWATGWDHKSVLLGVRDAQKGWTFFRLPKASHSYDGAHGWNTEWPRIRNVGTEEKPDYLMTMHGLFWHFPGMFTAGNSAGIRPRSSYLKVIGDFARWNDELVFGCDDSAQKEFLNKRKAKGGIEGPGQSNSNLWFTSLTKPDELGPATVDGAVWEKEDVKANVYSDPYMFAGWKERCCWLQNDGKQDVTFTFEIDQKGNNVWKELTTVQVEAGHSAYLPFTAKEQGEWVRVKIDKSSNVSASFVYTTVDTRSSISSSMFNGLSKVSEENTLGGLLYGLGKNRRALGILASNIENGKVIENGYYEMSDTLALVRKDDTQTADFIREKFAIPHQVVTIDESSVLIVDDRQRRWRLPLGDENYTKLIGQDVVRICREVATERDLFNCHGTFYELPAENADGYAKIRPIASHDFRINDYASYRGMLVMTGINLKEAKGNEHIIVSEDGKAAVWAGTIDDLWSMGKPTGKGGPWKNTSVKAGEVSDPYLIGFYDKKNLILSHDSQKNVTFTIEVDPTGNGKWMKYSTLTVKPGKKLSHEFKAPFQARWIRFSTDSDTNATAWLEYE
jgi:hypothetical protein